ncbi:Peroxiredoxin [Andreprevotia lacus DSM 23236]|uniref:Peroxiredoxin n=2 Tax=Andreprevotia TaxID=397275 RepID=A0A1W1XB27_9NEIS|nr:Peroxiredoxin [Andreprevotia lacus DSM 23236]
MPKKSLLISFLTILLLLLTLFTFMNTSKAMPAFSGNTQQGNAFNSSTLQGKVTLINFWATSCTGCVREVPALIQLQNDLNKTGFQVIGIALNYDEPAYIAKFVDKFGVNYPVIHDNTGSIADGFGKVTLAPTSFLIDSKGKIIKKYVGEVDIAVLKKEISGLQKNS